MSKCICEFLEDKFSVKLYGAGNSSKNVYLSEFDERTKKAFWKTHTSRVYNYRTYQMRCLKIALSV